MLLNADIKGLEVYCAAFLSQDKVLCKELTNGVDIHGENQKAFGLPTRLIAKTLIFRILYGGTEFSFAQDPEFFGVSKKPQYWAGVIEDFYKKYTGLKEWHTALVENVMLTGVYRSPTGREYRFKPYLNKRGEYQWPRTNILNYPVQGLGADMTAIMRVSLWKRLQMAGFKNNNFNKKVLPIATVHDSILLDIVNSVVNQVVKLIYEVAKDVPGNFSRFFGVQYTLPFVVEVEVGNNYYDMKAIQ